MNPEERLSSQEEKLRYDLHENGESPGYLAFFEPLIAGVEQHFASVGKPVSQMNALDFGCGPTALLSRQLAARGFETHNYDLYYHPNQDELRRTYNLVASTEVWEHLHEPRIEIERQLRLLKKDGLLAIMTSAHRGEAAFHDWHYRRDLTHVSFFSEKTMDWITQTYELHPLKAKSPYWIFRK